MDDDGRIFDDDALSAREGRPRRDPTSLQRMPPRLVSGMISAGISGLIVLLFGLLLFRGLLYPPFVMVGMFAAGIAGAANMAMALRRPSLVVIPAAVAAYVVTILLFFAAGLAVDPKAAFAALPESFLLSLPFAMILLAGSILWASVMRSWEDRLFTPAVRDASREGGARDYAIIVGWAAVAVVWSLVAITQL